MLVLPSRNPVRDQQYKAQIEYHKLPVKKRSLQARLKACTKGGRRYKQAYIKKEIAWKNKGERIHYGAAHLQHTIHNYWQFVFFTDEAHMDPSSQSQGYILREQGHRTDPENIQERGEKTGVVFHIAGWYNWWEKCEKLEFYKDEETYIEKPPKPPKPRRRPTTETEEEYAARLRE